MRLIVGFFVLETILLHLCLYSMKVLTTFQMK